MEAQVGGELVGDQLGGEEARDAENLSARDTEEEGDGIENVSENQVDCELVDCETLSDPGEQAVNGGDKGQYSQEVGEDETGNDEAEDSALGEGMEGVRRGIDAVLTPVHNDAAAGDGLLGLWEPHFRNSDRGRDTHHRGGNQVLRGNAKTDVREQN